MSMFLGPIHHWLYRKIEIGARRAEAIEKSFKETFGDEADSLMVHVDDKYPAFPPGLDLEDIIGDSPIHTFLQGLIRMVETREGALVKVFVDKFGEDAKKVAYGAAEVFGKEVGESVKDEIDGNNMESLFRALYDHQLDGMPCDQGARPEFRGDTLLIRQSDCLHSNNWQSADAPLDVMCKITGAWIEGFLKGAAPGTTYYFEASVLEGAGECEYLVSQS